MLFDISTYRCGNDHFEEIFDSKKHKNPEENRTDFKEGRYGHR